MSSAYKWYLTCLNCLITLESGIIYMINSSGPSTDPWGTPVSNEL